MRSRRSAAAEAFAAAELPSPQAEEWRYSRIADLNLESWRLVEPAADSPDPADHRPVDYSAAVVVSARNGVFENPVVPEELSDRGVIVALASTLQDEVAALGSVTRSDADVFVTLNDGFNTDAVVVSVPRGVVVEQPIVIRHHVDAGGVAVFPRLIVRLGEGAQARVVDQITSTEAAVLSVPVTELEVAKAARLGYVHIQDLGLASTQIGNLVGRVDQDGDLQAALIGLGGSYARLRTDVDLVGKGSNGDLLAAYFGAGDQTLDFRTFQNHDAPNTTSNLLFKGALGGRSRSIYTGLIRVDKNARGTNAFQTNRNIKLSDEAWAESVPNLEIETNDVRCSHASTVGPVDPEQHFYLESRGVPPQVADRLIVGGFFDEVVRALPAAEVIESVRAAFDAKLDLVSEDFE